MKSLSKIFISLALVVVLLAPYLGLSPALSQEPVHWDVVAKIREEGFQRSQVMEIARQMTEVYGPRLSGSPYMREAQRWAESQMDEWGLVNTDIEPWGEFGIGWINDYTSVHMTEPRYMPVIGYPKAWSSSTNGKISGKAVIVQIQTRDDLDKYRGTLRNAIILTAPAREVAIGFTADARRRTDEQLRQSAMYTIPGQRGRGGRGGGRGGRGGAPQTDRVSRDELNDFYRSEGIGVLLDAGRGDDGTVFVSQASSRGYRDINEPRALPAMSLAAEHYNRIYRLVENGTEVSMELEVRNTFYTDDLQEYNVIGEIRGTDRADEIVMVGGHYDSWHSGTGATDNAAGSAVAMEAVRILKAIGVPMRRTIRIALWSGEEQGLLGSYAYVANHFGNRDNKKPEYDKLSAYYQHDSGTGLIRGVSIQSVPEAIPIFNAWMTPFHDLGMSTLTGYHSVSSGGTDTAPFARAGLNGFGFFQDPIQYSAKTHHSNMDTFDNLIADDLMKNAVITASFLYHTAMRDEMMPRRK